MKKDVHSLLNKLRVKMEQPDYYHNLLINIVECETNSCIDPDLDENEIAALKTIYKKGEV